MTLSFGHLCKLKVTMRKMMRSLYSNTEILELLYFLSWGILVELVSASSLIFGYDKCLK